ncbi:dipeptidase [Halobacillus sp. K22]|uniref:dipeptidase n=1 Tax=Halobacillus sp. K22 TaxID=3457431 RepID=UPI003FCCD5A7
MKYKLIDGHNDTLLNYMDQTSGFDFLKESKTGHLDLIRAKKSGFSGGFFAIFTPNPVSPPHISNFITDKGYFMPLPDQINSSYAQFHTNKVLATMLKLEQDAGGQFIIVRSEREIRDCLDENRIGGIIHMEGAEAIDLEFNSLYVYHQAGLRSLGPVWSRANAFGEGVPYHFPSSPDTGPGLTEKGKQLIRLCNELGIMIDLSHMNEKGFWDTARLSTDPLVATHSNAHTLCPLSRNLTDKQLDAIKESNGVIGVTFCANMLRVDGRMDISVPLEAITDHIHYIADRIGIDHISLGSDFDGCTIPDVIKDVTGIPKLLNQLVREGWTEADIDKLTHLNWLRVLKETWT